MWGASASAGWLTADLATRLHDVEVPTLTRQPAVLSAAAPLSQPRPRAASPSSNHGARLHAALPSVAAKSGPTDQDPGQSAPDVQSTPFLDTPAENAGKRLFPTHPRGNGQCEGLIEEASGWSVKKVAISGFIRPHKKNHIRAESFNTPGREIPKDIPS